MKFKKSSLLVRFFAMAFACALPVQALAHPHGWIEIRMQLIFDDSGKVSALTHEWIQDEFTSAYNLEGTDKDGDGKPDRSELEILAAEFMENLSRENYFLDIQQEEKLLSMTYGSDASLTLEGLKLNLKFTTKLQNPVSIQQNALKYAFYDPTFYIEMLHVEGDKPITLVNAPKGCGWELEPPDPNPDLAAYALSLGVNESGGTSLGQHFAEWATIKCK